MPVHVKRYIEELERNECEQVPVAANMCVCVCFEQWKEKNLITPVIKAIIRTKKKILTQKCLSWKTSQLSLQKPIKRVSVKQCLHGARHISRANRMRKVRRFTGNISYLCHVHHLPTKWFTNTKGDLQNSQRLHLVMHEVSPICR